MGRDAEHLNLLAMFHFIYAGLTALFSSFFLFHVVIGVMIVTGVLEDEQAEMPIEIGWLFVIMGSFAVLSGWLLAGLVVMSGIRLRQRRWWLFCMIIAGVLCVMFPLGTVLGVFTIIVLQPDRVREMFKPRSATGLPEPSP